MAKPFNRRPEDALFHMTQCNIQKKGKGEKDQPSSQSLKPIVLAWSGRASEKIKAGSICLGHTCRVDSYWIDIYND